MGGKSVIGLLEAVLGSLSGFFFSFYLDDVLFGVVPLDEIRASKIRICPLVVLEVNGDDPCANVQAAHH